LNEKSAAKATLGRYASTEVDHFTLDIDDLENVTKLPTSHTKNSMLSEVFLAKKPVTIELFAKNSQKINCRSRAYANWRIYVQTLKK
jgi:hypothetical protein